MMMKLILAAVFIILYSAAFSLSCEKNPNQITVKAQVKQADDSNSQRAYETIIAKNTENSKNLAHAVQLPPHLSHIVFKGGDGKTCENAILIENAKNTTEGVSAEKAWLKANYPGSQSIEHAVGKQDGKMVEAFKLKTKEGNTINICFDVTSFFGIW
jgi:hypothetical protein